MKNKPTTMEDGGLHLEAMPVVVVRYHGLQQGFAQLAPQALFNVVGGEVSELVGSTVVLESLHARGYQVKEARGDARPTNDCPTYQPSTLNHPL